MCHVWDSVMESPFLRFSCTISNPVSMQELRRYSGKFLHRMTSDVRCRCGLHTMHAYALQFAKSATTPNIHLTSFYVGVLPGLPPH